MAAITPRVRSAIASREVQVVGKRLIAAGSGISIRPATGSLGMILSMRRSGRSGARTANIHLWQQAEQMVKLLYRLLRSAQGQYRYAVFVSPRKHVTQSSLAHLKNIFSCVTLTDVDGDLQLAIRHSHVAGWR